MFNFVYQFLHRIDSFVSGLDRTQWILLMVGVVVCGAFWLRGLSARESY